MRPSLLQPRGERRVNREHRAGHDIPAGQRQPSDPQLDFVAAHDLHRIKRFHEVVDVKRSWPAGAGGWSLPPMVLDPGVVSGEHGAGDEEQGEKREASPRQAMRRAGGEKRGQKPERNGGIEGVALGEAELAGRVAESLKYPDSGEDGDRRRGDQHRPGLLRGRQRGRGKRHQNTLIAITKPTTTIATNAPRTAAKLRSIALRNGSPNQCRAPATRKKRAPRVTTDKATNRGKL